MALKLGKLLGLAFADVGRRVGLVAPLHHARLLVGAGIALLLMGIGLRLRTADERRF